jgi:MFS family permease
VVSSLLAGAAVGSLSGSGLADSLGRKTTLLLDAAPLLAGALLSATASSLTALILGRVLAGVGIGLASALVPLYISEARACLP